MISVTTRIDIQEAQPDAHQWMEIQTHPIDNSKVIFFLPDQTTLTFLAEDLLLAVEACVIAQRRGIAK